jgi:hypothetical protein
MLSERQGEDITLTTQLLWCPNKTTKHLHCKKHLDYFNELPLDKNHHQLKEGYKGTKDTLHAGRRLMAAETDTCCGFGAAGT